MYKLIVPFRILLICISVFAVCYGSGLSRNPIVNGQLFSDSNDIADIAFNPNSNTTVTIKSLSGEYKPVSIKYCDGTIQFLYRAGSLAWAYRKLPVNDIEGITQLIGSTNPYNEYKIVELEADTFIVYVRNNEFVEHIESNAPQFDSLCRIVFDLSPMHFCTRLSQYTRKPFRTFNIDRATAKIGTNWDSLNFSIGYCGEYPLYYDTICITKDGKLSGRKPKTWPWLPELPTKLTACQKK